ncbi:MAG TPA: glycosyltransferase, partial [Roseateles sp.]|nr:glycosyltransferase [Roseateles sp.]HWT53674.1 glycosyltransferase [Rhodocyclaceae bacterium]
QNKVLEAMAMGRPVVAASTCTAAIDATAGSELLAATTAEDYVAAIDALLQDRPRADAVGMHGRQCVLNKYSWDAHLAGLDRHLPAPSAQKEPT